MGKFAGKHVAMRMQAIEHSELAPRRARLALSLLNLID